MMIHVRPESPDDCDAIANVNRLAFGGEGEARLVEALRASDGFDPELSLVAVGEGTVVGHVLFSPIVIEAEDRRTPALALAPMAVLPQRQRQGIGSELVRRGLVACRVRGHRLVVVLGHPEYYPRFGFQAARPHGILCPYEAPDEAFMVFALVPGALDGVAGTVKYPPAFDVAE
jgi:putative acetyltransferase